MSSVEFRSNLQILCVNVGCSTSVGVGVGCDAGVLAGVKVGFGGFQASVHASVPWVGAGVAFRPEEICAVTTVRASV